MGDASLSDMEMAIFLQSEQAWADVPRSVLNYHDTLANTHLRFGHAGRPCTGNPCLEGAFAVAMLTRTESALGAIRLAVAVASGMTGDEFHELVAGMKGTQDS